MHLAHSPRQDFLSISPPPPPPPTTAGSLGLGREDVRQDFILGGQKEGLLEREAKAQGHSRVGRRFLGSKQQEKNWRRCLAR